MELCGSLSWGSSPLTRGKLEGSVEVGGGLRLIPAHAGKTLPRRSVCAALGAHPRSRGENVSLLPPATALRGSSPLTRGKRETREVDRSLNGLIPAHAGKTVLRRVSRPVSAAHPRSRGENPLTSTARKPRTGSSPLTRGKRRPPRLRRRHFGLIPAHAGKTPAWIRTVMSRPAHPRSRGENPRIVRMSSSTTGSSPLTRGKHRPG